MSGKLEIDVSAFRRELASMDDKVRHEADGVIASHASLFAADLPSRYPSVTGNLRDHVKMSKRGELRYQVRAAAKHAHLYEYGTVRRFSGRGAYRGTMPARPTFVPWAIRWRERMVRAVAGRLRALRVPGFSGGLDVRDTA